MKKITCQYPLSIAEPKCGLKLDYNHPIYCYKHAKESIEKEKEHMVHYKDLSRGENGWVNEPYK